MLRQKKVLRMFTFVSLINTNGNSDLAFHQEMIKVFSCNPHSARNTFFLSNYRTVLSDCKMPHQKEMRTQNKWIKTLSIHIWNSKFEYTWYIWTWKVSFHLMNVYQKVYTAYINAYRSITQRPYSEIISKFSWGEVNT